VQDEISFSAQHKVLLGLRYDYNSTHGNILTPRFAYKWSLNDKNIIRFNAGTGFRVVNLFTEDHAALTGARSVIVEGELQPERSFNMNLNYLKKMYTSGGSFITLDATAWYTSFNNRIVPDYQTDPNKIFYRNLEGYAVSKGVTANVDIALLNGFKALAGITLQDVSTIENSIKTEQLLTERVAATWALSYKFKKAHLSADYTGNLYGPMGLPLLGPLDPRLPRSPAWSTQNIQLTWSHKGLEIYAGIKNMLNYTPNKGNPFIIARSHDPFDRQVVYEAGGQVKQTAENPYALTFDPTYVFAPNQGRRGFLGVRVTVR
jgi:outer membrane receptor for ferrienterochelin and colicins